jgi:hypothetical protein
MQEELLDRLDRVESRFAIEELASNYCHGFDKRDEPCFMGIWWEDCIWEIGPPFGNFHGHEGIRRALHDILWPAWGMSQHITSNVVITFTDKDHAVSRCDVDCTGLLAGAPEATFVGASYVDSVERREGVWKIKKRTVTMHYFNSFADTTLTKPAS